MNQSPTVYLAGTVEAVRAAGLFSSRCTIQSLPAPDQSDASGQWNQTSWVNVAGMVNIPCMRAAMSNTAPSLTDEVKLPTFTKEKTTWHVLLSGYYPNVTQKQRAVIDGVAYDILATEWDSQNTQTRLGVQELEL